MGKGNEEESSDQAQGAFITSEGHDAEVHVREGQEELRMSYQKDKVETIEGSEQDSGVVPFCADVQKTTQDPEQDGIEVKEEGRGVNVTTESAAHPDTSAVDGRDQEVEAHLDSSFMEVDSTTVASTHISGSGFGQTLEEDSGEIANVRPRKISLMSSVARLTSSKKLFEDIENVEVRGARVMLSPSTIGVHRSFLSSCHS